MEKDKEFNEDKSSFAEQAQKDLELRKQQEALEKEIDDEIKRKPLIGAKVSCEILMFNATLSFMLTEKQRFQEDLKEALQAEFKDAPNFSKKLPSLEAKYSAIRRVRPDGNCFYRSFMLRLLEHLQENEKERARVLEIAKGALLYLSKVGYEEMTIDTFTDYFTETLEKLGEISPDTLEAIFKDDDGESTYLVWFGRLVCGGFLKHNEERFIPFIMDSFPDIATFVSREIEPMAKEADQPQVIALAEFFKIKTCVEYIDSSEENTASAHIFGPDKGSAIINLLYRPGHYEILY